ncbi:MAG: DUF885 domain-containing protein, partial [Gammaproteobacteria bacterium]|nr:DUF885 domain-containing protein [Gammaproteobacteria bacterium]
MEYTRRTLLKTSVAAAVAALTTTGCATTAPETKSKGEVSQAPGLGDLLENATDLILDAYPESTSSAGIDKGKYARHKFALTDRSAQGQARIEANVRAMLVSLNAVDASSLTADEALNLDVVRTVFDMSAKGFDLAYGDVALLNSNWSWRNSPYAVAQNTGAFVEIPSFLDASHTIAS